MVSRSSWYTAARPRRRDARTARRRAESSRHRRASSAGSPTSHDGGVRDGLRASNTQLVAGLRARASMRSGSPASTANCSRTAEVRSAGRRGRESRSPRRPRGHDERPGSRTTARAGHAGGGPPMAGDDDGEVIPVNTDADRSAAAIAGELDAQLVLLTDVEGVHADPDDPSTLIERSRRQATGRSKTPPRASWAGKSWPPRRRSTAAPRRSSSPTPTRVTDSHGARRRRHPRSRERARTGPARRAAEQ